MPRARKPTNVLHLAGAFRKNPKRLIDRLNEPKPSGVIGEAPAGTDAEIARCWREVVAEAPPGVLTNADRGVMLLLSMLRLHAEKGDPFVTDKGVVVETVRTYDTKKLGLLLRCYTELGMTPASRSKVHAKANDEKIPNAFEAC
jgi:hypothetical protein